MVTRGSFIAKDHTSYRQEASWTASSQHQRIRHHGSFSPADTFLQGECHQSNRRPDTPAIAGSKAKLSTIKKRQDWILINPTAAYQFDKKRHQGKTTTSVADRYIEKEKHLSLHPPPSPYTPPSPSLLSLLSTIANPSDNNTSISPDQRNTRRSLSLTSQSLFDLVNDLPADRKTPSRAPFGGNKKVQWIVL